MNDKVVEVVFGNSLYCTMKKSKLKSNKIILFNTLFSVSNLSKINEYKLNINMNIECYKEEKNFEKEIKLLDKYIKENAKIRVWSSHKTIEPYLLLLFIVNHIKNKNIDIYVTYSEELNNSITPACLTETELEELSKLEHKINEEEQKEYSKKWQNLIKTNSPMRIIENNEILSVDLNYLDEYIINLLKEKGITTISKLTIEIMSKYHTQDLIIVYFIDKLIQKEKIKIVEKSKERHFLDKIKVV